jgi:hypothetical protein
LKSNKANENTKRTIANAELYPGSVASNLHPAFKTISTKNKPKPIRVTISPSQRVITKTMAHVSQENRKKQRGRRKLESFPHNLSKRKP